MAHPIRQLKAIHESTDPAKMRFETSVCSFGTARQA